VIVTFLLNMHKRFSQNALLAIEEAKKISKKRQLGQINASTILQAITNQKGSFGKMILESFGFNSSRVKKENFPDFSGLELIKKSLQLALKSKSPYIGTEHLVYSALNSNPEKFQKMTAEIFNKKLSKNSRPSESTKKEGEIPEEAESKKKNWETLNFIGEVNSFLENFLNSSNNKSERARGPEIPSLSNCESSALKSFCNFLGQSEEELILIGRQSELERIANILGRKMKNNPVLIGDPGVGKTAIIEGLATQISQGKAPYHLANKKIVSLDLGMLVAGTTFRGEFEARIKEILQETKQNPDIILFIDEIHNLIGAGNAIGGMDAANLLKPALARGEIQVIGATTIEEYRKHIEKDAALERRFQPILIPESTAKESIEIIEGIKPAYEAYHQVLIPKETIELAAKMADKYLHNRRLPDSAIDLIDESAAKIKNRSLGSQDYQKLRKLESQIEEATRQKEHLVLTDQYEAALNTRQKEARLLEKLENLRKKIAQIQAQNPNFVTPEDIKATLSTTANISPDLLKGETRVIAQRTKKKLRENLAGQIQVKKEINQAILRQLSGINNPDRPLGSFLFVGPTGVGKTLTAKLLAQAISPVTDQKPSLIQINMSEFMEKHAVSRLLGSPAGYVGYEEPGELSEKIRKNPYSVVLFDEIEKADSPVLNILLQILEEGEITDAKGNKVDFRNAIVILTSNIGVQELNQASQLGFEAEASEKQKTKQEVKETVLEELHDYLLPELINRLDSILVFDPLEKKDLQKVVDFEIRNLQQRLEERGIQLEVPQQIKKYLVDKSLDPRQGARLVRKNVRELIEPVVAKELLSKRDTTHLRITKRGRTLKVQPANPPQNKTRGKTSKKAKSSRTSSAKKVSNEKATESKAK